MSGIITSEKQMYHIYLGRGITVHFYSGTALIMYLSNINAEAQKN